MAAPALDGGAFAGSSVDARSPWRGPVDRAGILSIVLACTHDRDNAITTAAVMVVLLVALMAARCAVRCRGGGRERGQERIVWREKEN